MFDEAEHAVLRQRLARGAYRQVDCLTDATGRQTDVATKIISFAVTESGRNAFGFAGEQPVEGATRSQVQRISDVKEPAVRLANADVRPVSQPAGSQRSQHRHIAEAAARLLEIWLQQIGSIAKGRQTFLE